MPQLFNTFGYYLKMMRALLSGFFRFGLGVILLLLVGFKGIAQNQEPFILGGALQQGSVIVHTPKIEHFAGTHPIGFELNLQKQTTGTQYWQQLYRYPRFGLSLTYFQYQNPVLGQSWAFSPYLSLPVLQKNNSAVYFRFGTGLAYLSNRYNFEQNPTNNVISNNINAVIQTRLEYTRKISAHLGLLTAVGLNHYSNGGDTKPNLGLNIATATVGLNYYHQPALQFKTQPKPPLTQKNFVFINTSVGVKQRAENDLNKYIVNSIAVGTLRRLNQKSTLALALEGFYDPSLFPRRGWDPRVPAGTKPDIRRASLTGGHELNFGNLALGTHVGWYIYRPYKADAGTFQRLEIKWQFHKNLYLAGGLKLHDLIKADIFEYRLGVRI
ncbi:acyloxyacyl hydrolase [Adhaeribacter rhizoryzae]|uniref:Acyloxyacyl hydrolase n=1 Tax=Adhaeribacter rhizoryzae TaxID=2607907 RepID=A0A5M6DBD6_9BACT|nr:acyloxyacyl hydrolase [Adhaeribacter rhizoryzae]KAA5543359.1 acyloxyacyl hydrolase [Adhaeribacter rhizoryzae]